jgi:hypothetical protein
MKCQIELLISKYPKNYSQILQSQKYIAEKEWILANSKIKSEIFVEHIRSALYNDSNLCKFGNTRHLKSLTEGWRYCGHSSVCQCSLDNQKFNIKEYFSSEQNTQRKEKIKTTNLEKYGSISPFGNETVRQKSKNTNIIKYGEENYFSTNEFKQKNKNTNIKKYGTDSFKKSHIPSEIITILDNEDNFIKFATDKSIGEIASLLNVDATTIASRIKKYNCEKIIANRSSFEQNLKNFLIDEGVSYVSNVRGIIKPFELDFFIPTVNVAIECNGDYWHSDIFKDKNYHFHKWKYCSELGIQLIQIRETDWKNNSSLFKSMLKEILHISKNPVVGARTCIIKQINAKDARCFLEKNHLQGFVSGTSHWGGFDCNNNIVGVMTFGWTRGSKKSRRFELKRWATDKNARYIGLFSKTFKYAQSILKFDQVVSFSMNDWFTGNVYKQLGFQKKQIFNPTYYYLIDGSWRHCSALSKNRIKANYGHLPQIQEMLNSGATEFQLTNHLNILRYWDSGKVEWTWKSS